MASIDAEVMKTLNAMEKRFDTLTRTPASNGANPAQMFGFNDKWSNAKGWPSQEKVDAICKTYGGRNLQQWAGSKRKGLNYRQGTMGPSLVAIADSYGYPTLHNGRFMKDPGKLEEAFGLTSLERAARVGYKSLTGEVVKTALAENSGQQGGYIVPPQFINELLTIADEEGFIEPLANVRPMLSRTMEWPMLDITTVQALGTSPYFGGVLFDWQPEASLINETEPQFRQSTWTAWDLVGYSACSNQLLQDNGIGLDGVLTSLFGQALVWYKEYAFLRGTGTGSTMPLGILNAPATYYQSRAVTSKFMLADAAAMLSHLQQRSMKSACWIIHQSVLPQLIQMASGTMTAASASSSNPAGNQLVWLNPSPNNELGPVAQKLPVAFLAGLPLYVTDKLPQLGTAGDVVLADWQMYVIGTRLEMQIDVSPHYLFRNNQMAWRIVARCDGKPWLNGPIVDAEGWTVSPFVALSH
jgi:HK97 family phage major capsid protein